MNLTLNSSYYSQFQLDNAPIDTSGLPLDCMTSANQFNTECIYQTICPQLNNYFVNYGLGIIIIFILVRWFKWWFFKHGYIRFQVHYFDNINRRILWDTFIEDKLTKMAILFIAVVVFMAKWGT